MVLGPGGSGISVVAAAGAMRRDRGTRRRSPTPLTPPDRHTLLITVDRLSATPDLLGVFRVSGEPVAVASGLHLLTLDRLDLLEHTWTAFGSLLGMSVRESKVALPIVSTIAGIDAAELASLPGVEEFLLLKRIRDEATSGDWQRVVVDLSGTGDPFAVLRAPAVLGQALERLWPRHRRLAAAAEKPLWAQLTAAIDAIARDCDDITELLADADVVAAHLVVSADHRGGRVLSRHLAVADVMGLPVRSVVVNEGVCAGPAAVVTPEDPQLSLVTVAAADAPVDRPARLRRLAVALAKPTGQARGSADPTVVTISGAGVDSVFEMAWSQRLPDPQRFDLGRSGDDLLVTVDGFRYGVRLPSVLRRCVVRTARWDGTHVRVQFTPDPAVWPRDRGS
ncbi:ArsA-related P-loop ATPase [Gordonia sp. VNQ95]|uniref:ArsA-related P-loop ATPase n=1 Tax=Gordonia TaxID=2053 RepID=UPI0032B5429C